MYFNNIMLTAKIVSYNIIINKLLIYQILGLSIHHLEEK